MTALILSYLLKSKPSKIKIASISNIEMVYGFNLEEYKQDIGGHLKDDLASLMVGVLLVHYMNVTLNASEEECEELFDKIYIWGYNIV